MRYGYKLFGATFLALCVGLGSVGMARAQIVWAPVNIGVQVQMVTTAGITYADYSWWMSGCMVADSIGPVITNGTNFSFAFDLEVEHGVVCPDILVLTYTNVALGALAPGSYTLTTYSWSTPILTNTFTVPANLVLCPVGFGTNGSFQIRMANSFTNMSYILQCSTNCVDWTTLSTNSSNQLLIDTSPVLPKSRFYRVQMLQQ